MTSELSNSSDKTQPFKTSAFAQPAEGTGNVFQVFSATPHAAELPGKEAFVNLPFGHVFILNAL